jgi:hypothetical protein
MLAVVSHPDGLEAGIAAQGQGSPFPFEATVLPSARVSALERMRIYADMYYWRLIDVLRADFVGVTHALGSRGSYLVFHRYLELYPSRSKRLASLGEHLSRHLRHERTDLEHHHFLSELAQLEYTRECVFEAPRSPTLAADGLATLAPEQWETARLELVTASALVRSDFPVNGYLMALAEGRADAIPAAETSYALLVRGADYRVARRTLSLCQFAILTALSEGRTLAEAIEAGLDQSGLDVDDVLTHLGGWFSEWAALGLFSRIA